jgi:hypothetical protein
VSVEQSGHGWRTPIKPVTTTLNWIKGDPLLKNLEPDPRYQAFLPKMKLSE